MEINVLAVALATIAQFALGAVWYMPLFGNVWRDIHGFDKLTKAQQNQAQKDMMPMLGVQLVVTLMTTLILAKAIVLLPEYSAYTLAVGAWVGFMVPVQISGVIFGGTDPKWITKKIAVMTGGSLVCVLAAAAILSAM